MMDYSKISNIEWDGINRKDHPDYTDAYICYAEYDGVEMTEAELDEINDDAYYIHEQVLEYLN